MSSLTVNNIDEDVAARLRERAAAHGVSVSDEVRAILAAALKPTVASPAKLGSAMVERFRRAGGADIDLPERDLMGEPPRFE